MYIKVRAKTEAKLEKMIKKSKDYFEISVREKPKMNMANKKILEMVAKHFVIPVGKVRIVSGHHSPSKILSIDL